MSESPDWLSIAREEIDAESWRKVVRAMLEKAIGGDQKATDFIAGCVLPKDRDKQQAGLAKTVHLVLATKPEEGEGDSGD